MNLDTAEQAVAEPANDMAVSAAPIAGLLEAVRADPARAAALRDVWLALWSSRLLVWIAGAGTVATLGFGPARHAFDPPGFTRGFGRLGDLLAAPAARWDAAWYLVIAHFGYRPDLGALTAPRDAFFPLYPLGLSGLAQLGLAPVLAGIALSLAALAAALYGLHRLTALESTRRAARTAVLLTAFGPMAFYFSAVYSESLYLALSVGVFLFARRGRWGLACACASLAGATRSMGLVLIAPLMLLYLYGPRSDRPPDRPRRRRQSYPPAEDRPPDRAHCARGRLRTLVPRYRVRRDALWLALVPVGLGLYMGHLALAGGDPFAPFHAQAVWGRRFAGPYFGVWDGAQAAWEGLRQLASMQRAHAYFAPAGGDPFIDAGHNLMLFAFLVAALPMLAGVLRRLPAAYGAYALAALALALSYPVASQPLMSLPRFLAVLFPLNMWLGERLTARVGAGTRASARARAAVLGVSATGMAFFAAEFATWHWVA
jgi:hypothetical protein